MAAVPGNAYEPLLRTVARTSGAVAPSAAASSRSTIAARSSSSSASAMAVTVTSVRVGPARTRERVRPALATVSAYSTLTAANVVAVSSTDHTARRIARSAPARRRRKSRRPKRAGIVAPNTDPPPFGSRSRLDPAADAGTVVGERGDRRKVTGGVPGVGRLRAGRRRLARRRAPSGGSRTRASGQSPSMRAVSLPRRRRTTPPSASCVGRDPAARPCPATRSRPTGRSRPRAAPVPGGPPRGRG